MMSGEHREHIVKSYDQDLATLKNRIIEMGVLIQGQLKATLQCILSLDTVKADEIIELDPSIDAFEKNIDILAVKILALRHPVAQDLRTVISALKISSDLERIGDYAVNMAKRIKLIQEKMPEKCLEAIEFMMESCQTMIQQVLEAYQENDVKKAMMVWYADYRIDELYAELLQDILTYMMENAHNITSCTQLLFIAKNAERMGDHVTNISEMVYYQVNAEPFSERKDLPPPP